MSTNVRLAAARYGKSNVRLLRVVRDDGAGRQEVAEYVVQLLVEGEIDTSFTEADNSCVVATDSMKNIIYALAKTSPHILSPELFAIHLGTFILQKYAHLKKAFIDIEKLKWTRIVVDGKPHAHSFIRDGDEKHVTHVEVDGTADKQKLAVKVTSGLKDLLVLKSTGSAFENFVRDEYTTLVEVSDRILSTAVDLSYEFQAVQVGGEGDVAALEGKFQFDKASKSARAATLEIFATDESASVQASLFKMATRLIEENAGVTRASYALPNKHYVPVDMKYFGVENMSPPVKAEVFCPLLAPSGLITASASRV
ncbi:uricase [Exidia glandulosa HHB12029]|uniref:Uricase n=1 Tax=Exidia glandulosa HHB12029 TaxID=1314781 RepID=A0A165GHV7_EXIGL|nr:uricase [Exidia glandulosa HHB12029]